MGLLLVAQSARMLAQSAARAGLSAAALDYFADADTRRHAARCLAVEPAPGGFDEAAWLEAADRLAPPGEESGLVYGGGIDTRPGLVAKLARGRTLLGNSPATLRRVNTPKTFFHLLDTLAIPYPQTRFAPPGDLEGWLIKPGCGEGGKGVGFAAKKRPALGDRYYQRHLQGEAFSALFLADGRQARIIGFNTQWTAGHDPSQPFLFAGAVNRAEIDAVQRTSVEAYARKLTAALGLVGLNSLDFMAGQGVCQVLELNPRPSATMALYDEDVAEGLLAWHIAACRGRLPPNSPPSGPVRALRIVYAPRAVVVEEDTRWPPGCADIPNPGTKIAGGQPLCSLMAQGRNPGEAEAALRTAEAECLRGLPPALEDGRTELTPHDFTESRRAGPPAILPPHP